jgi:hypothetical protein
MVIARRFSKKKFLRVTGQFLKERKYTFKAKKSAVLSTVGKRDNHHVLLCPRRALYSLSVNSQNFRASTRTA